MKILNKKEFLKLPSGVIYSEYEPVVFRELNIKLDTLGNDFIFINLVGNVNCDNSEDYVKILTDAEENKKSFSLDFECTGRDGNYNEDALYAVYDKEDLNSLIKTLESVYKNMK